MMNLQLVDRDDAPVLRTGANAWRIARAERASVLIDAAAYFAALREAMRHATRSITIVGWDIDSRTRLVGEQAPADGLPETLGDFLKALVAKRPTLEVRLLLWDYSLLYALEREMMPRLALQWRTPQQIQLCLDDVLPFGSSHHQKIVVIDDAIAFSGGLDLTVRRWDEPHHAAHDARRVDPAGEPYAPFHDVQMVVNGEAAQALAALVAERWRRATGDAYTVTPGAIAWPAGAPADFEDVSVAISRTRAAYKSITEVREIESLLAAMIASARRALYIETQFFTCGAVVEALIASLKRNPALEVTIVAPRTHHTWLEHQTMQAARARSIQAIRRAGLGPRVRLVYPKVDGADVMVHAKVMIVDDRMLRVGSSNLCNRSMGTDTECDLTIEAATPEDRLRIRSVRARLLAEHLGATPAAVESLLDEGISLFGVIDRLSTPARGLFPIEDRIDLPQELAEPIEAIADPPAPLIEPLILNSGARYTPHRLHRGPRRWLTAAAVIAVFAALALVWRYTALAQWARPEEVRDLFAAAAASPWAPLLVIAAFVVGGLVFFPLTVTIAGAGMVFGAWPGLPYAAAGAMLSALAGYFVGRVGGGSLLRHVLGSRLGAIRRRIGHQGVVTIAAVRVVPIAPYTVINFAAGAMRLRLADYLAGTVIGLAPGLLVLTALGRQIGAIVTHPSWRAVALTALGLGAWVGVSLLVQRLVARRRAAREAP